ncbi:MAG: glutamine--tRNA ligase, partial [Mucinivorans sp.]
SALKANQANVQLYDRLFTTEDPEQGEGYLANLNPDSLKEVTAYVEPSLAEAKKGEKFQFERLGYFTLDSETPLVFNKTVGLRDSWAKINK